MKRYTSKIIRCFVYCFLVIINSSCDKINEFPHNITPTVPRNTFITVYITPSSPQPITATVSPSTTRSPIVISTPIPTTTPTIVLPTQDYQSLPIEAANQIRTMLIANNGDLWTGGPGGMVHWDLITGKYTVFTHKDGLASDDVTAIAQTNDDALWFGTFGEGISRFDGKDWQTYTTENGLPGNYITSLTVTPDGALWVDLVTTPYKAEPNYAGYFGHYDGQQWIPGHGGGYDSVMAASDGSFWASAYRLYLWHFDGKESLDIQLSLMHVTAFSINQAGVVWAATPTDIYRIVDNSPEKLIPPWIGQTDNWVTAITFAPNDLIWFGLSFTIPQLSKCGDIFPDIPEQGVYRYNGNEWTHFTTEDGLADNKICAAVAGLDGNVWFGTFDKGVSRFDGHNWTAYNVP
jgi:sugar lactone lactonase YvrE